LKIQPPGPSTLAEHSAMSEWFIRCRKPRAARVAVVCFDCAGGAGTRFSAWNEYAPADIEFVGIQLPGHGARFRSDSISALAQLVEAAGAEIVPGLRQPFACFGHSFGSLLAFELCRWLRRRNLPTPLLLSVASRRAPQLPLNHQPQHRLTDDRLTDALYRYGGLHPSIREDASLMRLLLPAIRTDLAMNETYQYCAEPPLACPVLGLLGQADTACNEAQMQAWQVQTSQRFESHVLGDGHFFHSAQLGAVVRTICDALSLK
jgi:medium-chain acyl-[acyl-carrier-protein] hydrolase